MRLIFAPHADDELIGCWSLFTRMGERRLVAYCEHLDQTRLGEVMRAGREFDYEARSRAGESLTSFIDNVLSEATEHQGQNKLTVWAPDPHWELHPLHKLVGALAHEASKRWSIPFGTYSTNMNVPYLRELSSYEREAKKRALDSYFPSQKSLWEHDHRYFLFEGMSIWNPPV